MSWNPSRLEKLSHSGIQSRILHTNWVIICFLLAVTRTRTNPTTFCISRLCKCCSRSSAAVRKSCNLSNRELGFNVQHLSAIFQSLSTWNSETSQNMRQDFNKQLAFIFQSAIFVGSLELPQFYTFNQWLPGDALQDLPRQNEFSQIHLRIIHLSPYHQLPTSVVECMKLQLVDVNSNASVPLVAGAWDPPEFSIHHWGGADFFPSYS